MRRQLLGTGYVRWAMCALMGWGLLAAAATTADATQVMVSVTNNAPAGGAFLTPVWIGFHDGSFDSYNGGLSTQPGLERLAEDGTFGPLAADFGAGLTYIDNSGMSPVSATVASGQAGADREQGTLFGAGGPVAPGETATSMFTIDMDGSNQYFSYASMVIPSNDYYVANGNPTGHDLSSLYGAPVGTTVTFNVTSVNDAGTEVNFSDADVADMMDDTIAALGLLGAGYVGQSMPDTGADENGVNTNVASAFGGTPNFLAAHPALEFTDANQYPTGLATVTISVVPEPSSLALAGVASLGMVLVRRRRRISAS